MTFALAGSLITQTGTDSNLSGLAAIVGVVTRVEGAGSYIKTRYYLPASTSLTYDILSFDPRKECLIFGTGGPLLQAGSATSVLTIGAQITQSGDIYSHVSEAIIFTSNNGNAYQVNQGFKVTRGTLNWYSGIIRVQEGVGLGAVDYNNGGVTGTLTGYIGPYATLEVMAVPSAQTNESCQVQVAGAASFQIDGMTIRGYGTVPPTVLVSLSQSAVFTTPHSFNMEGVGGITPQSNARTTTFATFYGLKFTACAKGLNWFLGSLIRGINQTLGSAVPCREHNVNVGHCQGYAELRNEVDVTLKSVAGVAESGIAVYCRDTNNGKRQTYALNGVIINNTADKVYLAATNAAGNVKFSGEAGSVLLAAVVRNTAGTVVGVDDSGLNAKDYRSISGTKGTDDFAFYYWGYGFLPQNSIEILKSNKVAKFLTKTLLADSSVTLSEAAAVAKLASSFTVSGNTLTVTANSTLDNVYDVMKAYKTRLVQTQLEYPNIGTQPIIAAGDQLVTAMTITVNAGVTLSAGVKFKSFSGGAITLLGSISGFEVAGNVVQNNPANLSNVTILGTLAYNTATPVTITFTNVTTGTVNNSGGGVVTVQRVNSTLIAGTNVVAVTSNILTLLGMQTGSDVVILKAGTDVIRQQVDAFPGVSFSYTYAVSENVDVGIFKEGYVPLYVRNYPLGSSNSSLPISQVADRNFQ